jgi:hypothetical protein
MINVTKSATAPLCLLEEKNKSNGTYRKEEIRTQLIADFNGKCYLCEMDDLTEIEIDHFIPHQDRNIDLKFDWNNLFFSCGHCNGIKSTTQNILNCTNPEHQILERILFYIDPYPFSKAEITATQNFINDSLTINTVGLLSNIYNYQKKDSNAFEGANNLRKKVVLEIMEFQKYLTQYFYEKGLSNDDKAELQAKIRRKLHPESPFTAFKVCIVLKNEALRREFSQFLPQ